MNKYTHWWSHLWYRSNHSSSSIVQDGGDTTINRTVTIYFRLFPDLCHHIGRGINPHGRAITGSVFRCGYSGLGIHVHVWVFVFWVFMLGFGYSFSGILIWVGYWGSVFRCGYSGLGISVQVWVFMFKYFTWHDYVITAVKFSCHSPHPCTDAHCPTLVNYPCTTSEQIPAAQSGGNTWLG